MSWKTKAYISLIAGVAAALLLISLLRLDLSDPYRFGGFLLVSMLASALKVRIPGLEGTYSLNFPVMLAAVFELDLGELLILAAACAVTQSYWRALVPPRPEQLLFNVSNVVISISAAHATFHISNVFPGDWRSLSAALAALGYYVLNTGMTAGVLCLVQAGGYRRLWDHWAYYTLPFYLLGSTLSSAWLYCSRESKLQQAMLAMVALYWIFRIFRSFLSPQTERRPAL